MGLQPHSPTIDYAQVWLQQNKVVACATFSSLVSTFAGYPLDSLKSRLQAQRGYVTVPTLAAKVWREEGIAGFFRGLMIPLLTISAVRAASFTIYTGTKDSLHDHGYLNRDKLMDVAVAGGSGGATSGALISVGSAPFELVKVRRQLEYAIAEKRGIVISKAPSTMEAVADIVRSRGLTGLYNGFGLHLLRDTFGTALYFAEYDSMRHFLGRNSAGVQGEQPAWLPFHIPESVIPFSCGSLAGVTSWALVYPLDVVKTKVQQRALSGEAYRGPFETLSRLVRGTDPASQKPFHVGLARLYRGLGVSAARSVITHGVLWTLFDKIGVYIDTLSDIQSTSTISVSS